jgi:hypothetical protein
MAYELLQNGTTQFAVDWTVVHRLLKSYHTAYLQYDTAREISASDSQWYNPMSWSLPTVSHIEVDWDFVRVEARARADEDLRNMQTEAAFNAPRVARRLEGTVEDTARRKELLVDWMGSVQTQNMVAVNKAVEDYESHIEFSKLVRDLSAEGLMVGASVMTGGGALAALGGASFFKGTCKYQDSGSVGAGVMEGAGSFVFAYVKLGKKFSFKQDMVLALVQAPYKTGTELVAGKSLSESVALGAVKLAGPGVDQLLKLGPAKTLFDRLAIPVVVTYGGKNVAAESLIGGAGILPKGAAAAIKKAGEYGAKAATASDGSPSTPGHRAPGRLVGDATISDKFLLYLGFVNMTKGIGHGW